MKIQNILFFLLLTQLLLACYDDKGNYNYTDKLDIRVEGIDKEIRVYVSNMLSITPKIYPENRKYDFFWGIAESSNTYSIIDTLSYERDLNIPIKLNTGTYLLRFCVKDVETGVFSYTEYTLLVETEMSVGWWILKDEDGNTDVDLFTPSKKLENVIANRNGNSLAGKPQGLLYTNSYWEYNIATEKDVMTKCVFVGSEQDLVALDFFTGRVILGFNDLFYEQPQRKVTGLFAGASDTHVLVDGRLYTMYHGKYDIFKQFVIKHTGEYQFSPHRHSSGWGLPLLFDELSSSFCTVTRNNLELDYLGNTTTPAPHKNLDMDLIFLGGKTVSNAGDEVYAILKKKQKEEYYIAHMKGGQTINKTPMMSAMTPISNTLNLLKSDFRTLNQNNNIIYFTSGRDVYSYNIDTGVETAQNISISESETITYMEFLKYNPWGMNEQWFDYVAIGTKHGNSYSLYLHPIQAGMLQPAAETMTGTGEVKRAVWIEMSNYGVYRSTIF